MDDIVSGLSHGEKLCDSIFRFYQPKVPVQLEVVFVHGLEHRNCGDSYWKTWLARDGTPDNVWPMTWLPAELPFAQVFALKYDGSIKQNATDGRMDLFIVGETLVQEMVNSGEIGQKGVPVVFVCHGFGGLVAKQIVVSAKQRFSRDDEARNFLRNIGAFMFYSTPHRGSNLAQSSSYFYSFKGGRKGPLLENLEVLNTDISRLSQDFEQAAKQYAWYFATAAETHEIKLYGKMMVEEASSRYEGGNYLALSDNHFDIVRPKTKQDSSYLWLINSLKEFYNRFAVNLTAGVESLVPDSFVRLKEQEEAIKGMLQEVSIVGLVGMGGIGKTTLAKAVYDSIRNSFDRSSYLDDVKSKASLDEVLITLLQNFGIIDRRTGYIEQQLAVKDSRKTLLEDLKTYVQEHTVLVVVDDVGKKENLACLLKDMDFSNGKVESKVIVTCRNWQELKDHVPVRGRYEVEPMRSDEETELFAYHAFEVRARTLEERRQALRGFLLKDSSERLMDEFESVCDDVVKACGGLPLSLEVMGRCLGGYLRDGDLSSKRCLDCWRGALEKLEHGEPLEGGTDNDKLWKVLRVSYDLLHKNEQNMFLDIACFFCDAVRYGEQTLLWIWGGEHRKSIELRNLKERYLVKINKEDGSVTMHEQLRDMGRSVVKDEGKGDLRKMTRLWNWKGVRKVLQSNEIISTRVQGLSFQGLSLEEWGIKAMASMEGKSGGTSKSQEILKQRVLSVNCPEMRLLNLHEVEENVIKAISIKGSPCIQWLCMKGVCIFEVPRFVRVCNELRVLDMRDCNYLKNLDGSIENLVNLLELNLSHCYKITSLPDSIGKLVNLSKLDLSYCEGLTSLPDSIGNLDNLSELNLCYCKGLTSLPDSIGNLDHLSNLNLSYCKGLTSLSDSIGKLVNLSKLNLFHCYNITGLPDSIGELVKISKLHLSCCEGLTSLPNSIGELVNISKLDLFRCEGLTSLPNSIGNLVNLFELDLSYCKGLTSLPDSIGSLDNLSKLNLSCCEGLTSLPNSIGNLDNLFELDLSYCKGLTSLPDSIGSLDNLSKLNLSCCEGLTSLPDSIGELVNLSELNLSHCMGLTSLPDSIGELVNSSKLNLSHCMGLTSLPDSIGELVNLSELNLSHCMGLTSLPDAIDNLNNLSELNLSYCEGLTSLVETLGDLTRLKTLEVRGCTKLVELPQSTGRLSQLSCLGLELCYKWEWMKASQISLLHELQQHGCSEIRLPDGRRYHGKYSSGYCSSGGAECDGCGLESISTKCWHCDVCPQFDLCESCYERRHVFLLRQSEHDKDHPLTAIAVL